MQQVEMTDNRPHGYTFNEANVFLLSDYDAEDCGAIHRESGILFKSSSSQRTQTSVDNTVSGIM